MASHPPASMQSACPVRRRSTAWPSAKLLEAQASGLPVVAVAAGGPLSLIDNGVSGLLCPPDASALADAVLRLAGSQRLREHLARAGLAAARQRTWERALERLGEGYGRVLSASDAGGHAGTAGGVARAA